MIKKPVKYELDELVKITTEHRILRLPPYHCIYNPIELIWGLAKRYFDAHVDPNHDYSDEMTKRVWADALATITPEVWRECCTKVKRKIVEDYKRDVADNEDSDNCSQGPDDVVNSAVSDVSRPREMEWYARQGRTPDESVGSVLQSLRRRLFPDNSPQTVDGDIENEQIAHILQTDVDIPIGLQNDVTNDSTHKPDHEEEDSPMHKKRCARPDSLYALWWNCHRWFDSWGYVAHGVSGLFQYAGFVIIRVSFDCHRSIGVFRCLLLFPVGSLVGSVDTSRDADWCFPTFERFQKKFIIDIRILEIDGNRIIALEYQNASNSTTLVVNADEPSLWPETPLQSSSFTLQEWLEQDVSTKIRTNEGILRVGDLQRLLPEKWLNDIDLPRQKNFWDCGVFLCTYAEYSSRKVPFDFSQDDIRRIRRKYSIHAILSSQLTFPVSLSNRGGSVYKQQTAGSMVQKAVGPQNLTTAIHGVFLHQSASFHQGDKRRFPPERANAQCTGIVTFWVVAFLREPISQDLLNRVLIGGDAYSAQCKSINKVVSPHLHPEDLLPNFSVFGCHVTIGIDQCGEGEFGAGTLMADLTEAILRCVEIHSNQLETCGFLFVGHGKTVGFKVF
nr:PREDICTED: uncharacterized protein LOC105272618 [Fopius arisanus]